jgi:hypothetical protein
MIELKYKSWKEISVNTFNKLKEIRINSNDSIELLDSNITLLSILCDVDEDTIADLTTSEFSTLLSQTAFLKDMPKVKIQEYYKINGKEYQVFLSMKNMTVSQYIDFQTFYKEQDKYFKELLACFIIPKGKKYGEDYDVQEVIDDIGNYLSIVDANSILFFFVLLYQSLTKAMLTYSIQQMKKAKRKMNKEEREKIDLAIEEVKRVKNLVGNGYGYTL